MPLRVLKRAKGEEREPKKRNSSPMEAVGPRVMEGNLPPTLFHIVSTGTRTPILGWERPWRELDLVPDGPHCAEPHLVLPPTLFRHTLQSQ